MSESFRRDSLQSAGLRPAKRPASSAQKQEIQVNNHVSKVATVRYFLHIQDLVRRQQALHVCL